MRGWQAYNKRTCAQPVSGRAMPENEIPPVLRGDTYFILTVLVRIFYFLLYFSKKYGKLIMPNQFNIDTDIN